MATRGEVASTTLIQAAERLFAERGIESVSLRDISAAAGQRNHSAAQYHFGDRAGLVAAVFEHRMREVNDRRHRLLDDLAAQGRDDLEGFVDATVRPLVEVVEETDGWYARFLVRARWDTFAQGVVADAPVLSSFRRVVELILSRLDGPFEHRLERIDQMTTLLIGTIAGWEWRGHDDERRPSADALRADLAGTCRAVLTARAAERTTAGSTP
ncbi:MAG: TetR family transcriptional regulator [Actinobacteria bacterium]|nr:TetR family transcriptional regulator [Actinomycetota bacterium]